MQPSLGTSVIAKVGLVLRTVGTTDTAGATTSAVARGTGLPRPTTHRLLTDLADQGFVDRNTDTGRWHLGPELYLLGTVAAARYDVSGHVRDVLADLAEQTGESAYFSVLRGRETVCLAECEGSFPLRSHVLYEGIRFPLGVASAGLALLSHLPGVEARDYIAATDLTTRWGRSHSRRALRSRVSATLERGYAVNPGLLVEGSWGLAAVVFDRAGRPRSALTLTGVRSRFTDERIPTLGRMLLDRAHLLSRHA
ncbi:putative IclR-family regulatory protein [Pseudonocardia sulfidoxydans NBRC 16205]|uniref:Putative IclR-family regulatory protein n=1 Tax=Pseudonocardia sulfidoxydans NBRC 16205 TaxID=1223511 RepID=A0A511DCB0_9PSEU|nr:IclR family transcriptional regulator [Pseudonocardia sulfidoxydans]GEL22197.1 putative IclR-family regulatory protein [Pseudonocardia sulfidoxydans NBRC 16205]